MKINNKIDLEKELLKLKLQKLSKKKLQKELEKIKKEFSNIPNSQKRTSKNFFFDFEKSNFKF